MYHIPASFTADRPRLRYAHASFDDTPISAHPLASLLPHATNTASVQVGSDVFRTLTARNGVPDRLEDYLDSDEPPLELHVLTFRDATLVLLTFPHVLTDAVGLSALLKNWCRVLAGRDEEVEPLADGDPLMTVGKADGNLLEPHALEPHRLTGLGGLRFGLNFLWDIFFGPKMEMRTVFLPAAVLEGLKRQAQDGLQPNQSSTASPQFLSDGDVLAAWSTKLIAQSLGPRSSASTLTVFNIFELRSRLPHAFPPGTAYVLNAFSTINTFFTVPEAQSLSLGMMALRFREAIVAQTAQGQVETLVRMQCDAGRPVLCTAGAETMLVPITNWGKARFYDIVDFAPAVVAKREKNVDAGKPVLFLAMHASPTLPWTLRHVINIIGKDRQGNCWISGILGLEAWKKFDEEIAKM